MSYKKFTKNVGLLELTQAVTALSGLFVVPTITKMLGAADYGVWVQLMVTQGLISTIANAELPHALVRFLPGEKDQKQIRDGIWSVFTLMAVILAVISSALVLFSHTIAGFLGSQAIFVVIIAPIIAFECFNFLFANVFRAFQEIKKYCYLAISQRILETVLIIATVFLGHGLMGAMLSIMATKTLFFFIMGGLVIKKTGTSIPRFLKTKEYLAFSLPLIPTNISYWITQSSDKYFIGFFFGALFVGYYAPAYTLGSVISFFMTPISFLLPAIVSKLHDENQIDEVKEYIQYSIKYFLLISIPAIFGLSVLSRQLLTTFSTEEIAAQSHFLVPIIGLSMVLFGVYTIISSIFWVKKKTRIGSTIWMVAALLNITLNFLFVRHLGILGAALTTLAAYMVVAFAGYYYTRKEIQLKIDWGSIAKSILASAGMAVFVNWLSPRGLYQEIIVVAAGALLYGIFIILLKAINRQELALFQKILRKD